MSETLAQRSRLDSLNTAVAIVHSGMFVYANTAYLKTVHSNGFEDLESIPLLDLVQNEEQEKLKNCLHQAEIDQSGADSNKEHVFTLQPMDESPSLPVGLQFKRIEFDGEICIQIIIKPMSHSKLLNKFRGVAWSYYLSILVLLFLSSLPNLLLLKLNINNAPTVYFPSNEPAILIDEEIRENFPSDQVIVFLFEGVALYSDGFLNAYNNLAETLKENPNIEKVMSVTTQDHISGSEEGFVTAPLIDVEELDASHPSERAAMILKDRFARNGLIAKNTKALSMVIIPIDMDNSIQRLKLLKEVHQQVEDFGLTGYLTAVAGQIPVDVAQLDSMLRDNAVFIPATTMIGLLLIWLLFHRILAVVVSGAVIGVIVSSTIALYVIADQPFTLIASITPPLLSALTIAALVHLFNALHYGSQRGLIGRIRVDQAVNEIKRPALFATLTTAAGLASLGMSPIPAIANFGLIAAFGVLLIFAVVLFIVPQIFIRWDHSVWPTNKGGLKWMDQTVRFLTRIGVRYPIQILLSIILLMALGIPQISKIKIETNLQKFFLPDHPIRIDTDKIDALMVGTMPLEVVFKSEEIDALKEPEHLKQIKAFQDWTKTLPQIDKSTSLVDFIEEMNWGFHEEDPIYRKIPENADLISQYLLVYDGNDLFDLVDEDYQTARVTLSLNVHSANDIGQVIDQIKKYLNQNIEGLNWEIAGAGRLFSDMEDLLIKGQMQSMGGALLLIFILMLFLWRSLGQSILCMVPNLAPIVFIFIMMGLLGIWLDVGTAMIASVAVGIAVDDTIHIFHGFRKRLDKGSAAVTALIRTTSHAGRAIMTTTIILTAQFLILLLSGFVPTSNFGLLTSIGLVTALLFDVLVLPAILMLIYHKKR